MTILVTGAAGFIGFHVANALLARGEQVVGIDNLNDYYDPALKQARLAALRERHGNAFAFEQVDFGDQQALEAFAARHQFDRIVHLGAQAGVAIRWSIRRPMSAPTCSGQVNMLELARAPRGRAFRLCQLLVGLWRQHRRCRSASRTASTIRSRSMPRPRRPTN